MISPPIALASPMEAAVFPTAVVRQNDKWAFVCLFHLYFLDSIYTIRLNFFSRSRFVMAMIVGRPCGQ